MKIAFEELSEESGIADLRAFVEQEGLNVKDRSKAGLYGKICECYKVRGGQRASSKPQAVLNVPTDTIHFEDLSEESGIADLRAFVEQEGLGVTDRSKAGLYGKICECYKVRGVQRTPSKPQDVLNVSTDTVHSETDTPVKSTSHKGSCPHFASFAQARTTSRTIMCVQSQLQQCAQAAAASNSCAKRASIRAVSRAASW
jgi:hypothetical protein